MNERTKPNENVSFFDENKFSELSDSVFTYAVVIRGTVADIQTLKSFLAEKKLSIRYQRMSTEFLKITAEVRP
jgi:hypothetical protein